MAMVIVLLVGGLATGLTLVTTIRDIIDERIVELMRPAQEALVTKLQDVESEAERRRLVAEHMTWGGAPTRLMTAGSEAVPSELRAAVKRSWDLVDSALPGVVTMAISGERWIALPLLRDEAAVIGPAPQFPGNAPGPVLPMLIGLNLLVVGLVAFLLVRPIERKLGRLEAAARRFGRGELAARAELASGDAIGQLGASFDGMADRVEALVGQHKQLLAAVSHELRTPMMQLAFAIDMARDAGDNETDRERHLATSERSLDQMQALVDELLELARLDAAAATSGVGSEEIDLTELARQVVSTVQPLPGSDIAAATLEPPEGAPAVVGHERELDRALSNLVSNALRHTDTQVVVSIESDGSLVRCHVDDDGPGVPEASRQAVFEPFVRLDESRNRALGGVGLGLAIVARIAKHHGGRASVTKSPLGGARFTLELPLA